MPDQMSAIAGLAPLSGRGGQVETPAPVPSASEAVKTAQAFEAAFLAEMLKHAGVGEAPEGFGGGVGEDQFAGFLREAQAREMAAAGGIGIAEFVMRHLQGSQTGEIDDDPRT